MGNRKLILVVDDNDINRKSLCQILSDEYDTLQAVNGEEALAVVKQKKTELSAIFLDLVMPIMNGYVFLEEVRKDAISAGIPVIVLTQYEQGETEERVLSCGASDFLTKPYNPTIIKHRVANLIQLRETSSFVTIVEKDALTGLYSREAFFEKAREWMLDSPDKRFDVIVIDIERFKLVNDLFGKEEGDKLLQYLADILKEGVQETGICGRLHGDVFVALVERQSQYPEEIFTEAVQCLRNYPVGINIQLKFGIYQPEEDTPDISVMCERAELVAESIKGDHGVYHAFYDKSLRERLMEEQQIISDMKKALEKGEFQVYFQPKIDLITERVIGAETLVRWEHPQKGFMAPNEFIPLFEKNGFITSLDIFVWDSACKAIREWMDCGQEPLPISVNLSPVDIYHPDIVEILSNIVAKYQLQPERLHLEITEIAYTENPEQIIAVATDLKKLGFIIEMDDFGTGSSSLNMLSELPIDILKIDMRMLKSKLERIRKTNVLNFIVSLAKWLGLMVVSEGVETKEQVMFLRSMGCDYGQGFYFVKPLPKQDFEHFLVSHRDITAQSQSKSYTALINIEDIWDPMSQFSGIFNEHVGALAIYEWKGNELNFVRGNDKYFQLAGIKRSERRSSSFEITTVTHPQDKEAFVSALQKAQKTNGEFTMDVRLQEHLLQGEYRWLHLQMKVIQNLGGKAVFFASLEDISKQKELEKKLKQQSAFLETVYDTVTCGIAQLSVEKNPTFLNANITMAQMLGYESKEELLEQGLCFADILLERWKPFVERASMELVEKEPRHIVNLEFQIKDRYGLTHWVHAAAQKLNLVQGSVLQVVFTDIALQKRTEEILIASAQRDSLTQLLNRSTFETLVEREIRESSDRRGAFMILDLDNFKGINDTSGHHHGDLVLQKVAEILKSIFRPDDYISRIGGDEYSIYMRNIPHTELALKRANQICEAMRENGFDKRMACSVGVSIFPQNGGDFNTLYKRADEALYYAKSLGKNQIYFFEH